MSSSKTLAFLLPRHILKPECTQRWFQNGPPISWTRTLQRTRSRTDDDWQDDDTADSIKKKKKKKKNEKRYLKADKPKELFRAERVLANRSGKSRAECHKLLTKFAVSILEEDEPTSKDQKLRILSPRDPIPMTARIFINQKFEVPSAPPLLMVYHKPKWVLSTMGHDARERTNLQNLNLGAWRQHFHPVGRLDYDTSGLLLFSSSGPLTQHLLHPKFQKEKEYAAVVVGAVRIDELRERLQAGIELADLQTRVRSRNPPDADHRQVGPSQSSRETFTARADLLEVQHVPLEEVAPYLARIRETLPNEYNVTDLNLRGYLEQLNAQKLSEIRLVVSEGKHRMVRRMLASCGHPVVSLKRERMGIIELGDLPEGAFRNITAEEEAWAKSLVKSKG